MLSKRITLFAGHYGSGKTSVALSAAVMMRGFGHKVALADLDIVNPYFRAKDDADVLKHMGIELIASRFANSNVDLPALPQQLYSLTDNKDRRVIIDVGGDDSGALALGRLTPAILRENDYEMLLVVNKYRPLTRDENSVQEIKQEIETACKIPFTGIVNNSNLGVQTTAQDIKDSISYARGCAKLCGIPVVATTVAPNLVEGLRNELPDVLPVTMMLKNNYI